ncbi:MAG: type II secretion system secretin GspD [Planctomycetes bacterium]|nr:type II secretion system secretin GspD [Planctomycetota bacterium]
MGRRVLVVLLAAILVGLAVAPAVRAQQDDEKKIPINFKGVDLGLILEQVSQLTGVRFLYDEKIKAKKVFLTSQSEIPIKHLYSVFQSVMKVNGFALIESGPPEARIVTVVDLASSAKGPSPVFRTGERLPETDQMVTLIISLKYADPRTVQAALQPLVNDPKGVLTIDDPGTIIVTDYAPNVRRIEQIAALMDREKAGVKIEVVQLFYASAQDVEQKLTRLVQILTQVQRKPGQAPEVVQVTADPRTNKLVLLGQEDRLVQLKGMVQELDVQIKSEPQIIHVYNLKHGVAKIMAENLSKVYQAIAQSKPTGQSPTNAPILVQALPGPGGAPGAPGGAPGGGGAALVASSGPSINPSIVADEQNNALIIVADDKTYANQILPTIQSLDVRRPQVMLEAALVEITGVGSLDLGVEISTVDRAGNALIPFGSTSFGLSTLRDTNNDGVPDAKFPFQTVNGQLVPFDGLTAGAVKQFGGRIPAILRAFKTRRDTKVLAQPYAVVNDNTSANLKVTDADPITTTVQPSAGGVITSFGGFQEAGITLSITPHISEAQYLRLEIDQKLENFVGQQIDPAVPRAKNTRQITDQVTIPNGHTLIIGGLTRQDEEENVAAIPGLSDIPWIGELFKRTQRNKLQITLYIFITPTILSDLDFADYNGLSRQKQEGVRRDSKGKWWVGVRTEDETESRSLDLIEYKSPFPEK